MQNLQIAHATTISALRTRIRTWREDGLRIGFVPTMGALHDGHISLVRLAKAHCDRVVASIFVNPKQFAAGEDLDTYPRTMIEDAEKLTAAKCDLIYLPTNEIMYPQGYSASVSLQGPALGLESEARPHFFHGVATVVAKLFNQVGPDMAFFGEKDYQQLLVIKQMVKDLDFPIDIMGGGTMREKDGLAMSSRNAYLSAEQRATASRLNAILKDFATALEAGRPVAEARAEALSTAQAVFDGVDYVEARCAATLSALPDGKLETPARVLAAVRLGQTRLIDNMAAKTPS
ncbi:pantoate--beta-alanine ligase [Maricaulis parjimensis]|uniref:pantoate--beta-alanine ligase n=1 Tax=Maricaulis parjimensis TaxID=144023 RepID=UPI0019394A42|nr:pantoate--beta-alanine ligase [Maricaulis parjimensis]